MAGPRKIGPIAGALTLCMGVAWTGLAGAGEAPAAYYPSLGYGQTPPWVYAEAPGQGEVSAERDRALVYGEGPPPGYVGEPAYGSDFGPEGGPPEPDFAPDPGSYGPPREEGYDSGWVGQERAGPGWRSYAGSRVQTYDYDSGWRGSGSSEREIGPPEPLPPTGHGYNDGRSWRPCCAPPPPCGCGRMQPPVRPMAYQPGLRLNDRFFADSGGVGPAYFGGGGGGGGGVYVVSGGSGRASASASAFAAASARASVSIRGRGGFHGGGHCCGK